MKEVDRLHSVVKYTSSQTYSRSLSDVELGQGFLPHQKFACERSIDLLVFANQTTEEKREKTTTDQTRIELTKCNKKKQEIFARASTEAERGKGIVEPICKINTHF